jgi:PilZ domain
MSTPRSPRFELRLSAELRVGRELLTGTTRNLSDGGVCVEIDRPLTEGAVVVLMLFLVEDDVEAAGSRGIELVGSVRWSAEADRGYAVGVQFGSLSPAQKAAIARVLQTVERVAAQQ